MGSARSCPNRPRHLQGHPQGQLGGGRAGAERVAGDLRQKLPGGRDMGDTWIVDITQHEDVLDPSLDVPEPMRP